MKKFLLSVLVLVLSLSLIACGGSDDENNEAPTPTESVTTTPEVTPEATPEPTATTAPVDDNVDGDDAAIEVTPEATPEPTEVPETTDTSSANGIEAKWVIDRDKFWDLYVNATLEAIDESDGMSAEDMITYLNENREYFETEFFAEIYTISFTFDGDGICYLYADGDSEEALYEVDGDIVRVYTSDDENEFQELTYDAENGVLYLANDELGMTLAFTSQEYGDSPVVPDDSDDPENDGWIIDDGDDGSIDFSGITGDPINSLSEVEGEWAVDMEAFLQTYISLMADSMGITKEEFSELLASSGTNIEEMIGEMNMKLVIGDECYLEANDERQNVIAEVSNTGLTLYNADDPSEESFPLVYDAATDRLLVSEDGIELAFIRQ